MGLLEKASSFFVEQCRLQVTIMMDDVSNDDESNPLSSNLKEFNLYEHRPCVVIIIQTTIK